MLRVAVLACELGDNDPGHVDRRNHKWSEEGEAPSLHVFDEDVQCCERGKAEECQSVQAIPLIHCELRSQNHSTPNWNG